MVIRPTTVDIRNSIPAYKGLTDPQINTAIDDARAYLDGLNPDWRRLASAYNVWKLASVSMTLQLHFPQASEAYTALDKKVVEMVTSMWSSSFMLRKRTRFCRLVNPK